MNSIIKDTKIFKGILIVLLLLQLIKAESQSVLFEHLTSNDGLSQSEVYAFLEDSRGFIWIGTLDGLNRFDGYNIKVFNTDRNDPHSLSNNTIRCLKEDNLGRIWIGTDDGLNLFDPLTELIYQINIKSDNSNFSVWSLFIKNNNILVGTNDGLWTASIISRDIDVIESGFHKTKHFSKNQNISLLIRTIIPSKFGGLWIQTSDNISRIAFQEFTDELVVIEDLSLSFYPNQTTAVEDSSGNLWIASSIDGLLRYNPEKKSITTFLGKTSGLRNLSEKCSALCIDKSGNLWVGTLDNGIYLARSEVLNNAELSFKVFQSTPSNLTGLNSNLIYSLYVSVANNIWVGTIGSGVNLYSPEQKKFMHYKLYDSFSAQPNSNFVRSVYAIGQNIVLVGMHNDGLYLLNLESGKFQKLGFGSQSIFYIGKYSENKQFICSSEGIYLIETANNKINILSDNSYYQKLAVFNVTQSKDGIFWYASLHGINRFKVINNRIVIDANYSIGTKPEVSVGVCRVLYFNEKHNKLFIGTEGGGLNIATLDENQYPLKIDVYKKSDAPLSISNNYIRAIISGARDNIWIGTYEGLNEMLFDSISGVYNFKTYTMKDGLPNNMIQLLVKDNNQCLWVGTNGGLSKFNPETEELINYTVNDGIQSREFSEHAAFKNADGMIIVGGINGLNTFYPDKIHVSSIKPRTTLTGFYLFNEKVKPLQKVGKKAPLDKSIFYTDTIVLLPKQKNIGFEFSAMIYPIAEKVKYAYKLEGFENEWHYTNSTNRIANYTNLKYGKYKFIVKSSNPDGVWGPPRGVFLQILTPFKYTIFAFVIYVLLILLIFSFFSLRFTTKKSLSLQKEHGEQLHKLDELRTRFFINISHDLRTPLTLIMGPLDKILQDNNLSRDIVNNLLLIKRNVKRLNYLVEQLLDFRKSEAGVLSPKLQIKDLVSFTREEIANFSYAIKKKGISLKIVNTADKVIAQFDPGMISKVYSNIISNAIKFTDKGGIEISINRVNKQKFKILQDQSVASYVSIEIRDSGRGMSNEKLQKIFNRFYQDEGQTEHGYGIGLSHAKDLIDAHKGFIEVESKENVGTTIRIFLPEPENLNEDVKPQITSREDIYVEAIADYDEKQPQENSEANTILIVEDNDDMLNFIANELKAEYNILKASDGIEGLTVAGLKMPDLIICDILMPNMDGIEFCKKIKTNIKTSHIPVILLTAMVETETKYKSIEVGADDFIPKPFEIEYLNLRIKNLLHSREELRKLFQKSINLEPSKVAVTSIDQKFIELLTQSVEKGIGNAEFTINSLESDMGMSHANFYRKIKSLTGQSAQELLLNMRMKRAHQILSENKGIRISEVAYMVGFTNPKYFSKCFKAEFGFAPSDIK